MNKSVWAAMLEKWLKPFFLRSQFQKAARVDPERTPYFQRNQPRYRLDIKV